MECQDADDAFWEAIRGKKIGFRVNREDFNFVANGGRIRTVIYLPVQDGVFGDELETLAWKKMEPNTLELTREEFGQPVVSVLMEHAREGNRPGGAVGRFSCEKHYHQELRMRKTFHFSSFLIGAVGAALLFFTLGAANQQRKMYDVESTMGGLGLHIVDLSTNQLYGYRRSKSDDGANYELVEQVDLSLIGEKRIPVQASE